MDPISIALGLASFAPSIIKLFTGSDKDSDVAAKVVGIAQTITGKNTPDDALSAVQTDPAMALKLQQEIDRHIEAVAKIDQTLPLAQMGADAQALQAVNTTMQQEAISSEHENNFQKGWRAFNGYVVGLGSLIGVVFTCYLFYLAVIGHDTTAMSALPQLITALAWLLGIPGAAVGIKAWHDGKAIVEKAKGDQNNS